MNLLRMAARGPNKQVGEAYVAKGSKPGFSVTKLGERMVVVSFIPSTDDPKGDGYRLEMTPDEAAVLGARLTFLSSRSD